jgi:hypothetical protein
MEEPKKPWYSLSGFLWQLVFVGCISYWSWRWPNHLPEPGYAVTILGLAAVVMAVRANRFTRTEEIVWIVVAVALCFVEIRAIRHDRNVAAQDQAEARQKEEDNFRKIADGITNSIQESDRNFAQTMRRSDRIVAGVGDSVRTQTGGDSFAFITLTGPQPAIITFNGIPHPDGPWMLVSITSHGKYPLRDVYAVLMDDERRAAAVQEYNKHPEGDPIKAINASDTHYHYSYLRPQSPEAPNGEVETLGAYEIPHETLKRLTISFSSLNGNWTEILHLGLVDRQWHQCLSVLGPTVKQFTTPFIWCDSDWPEGKRLAEKDWAGLGKPAIK